MISHFNLSGSETSFYCAISTIQQDTGGLKVSGIVGDGSAEAWFEARVAEQLQVCVFPIWEGGSDSLCQRYEQSQIEQALVGCFEELSFRSESSFDPESGCWQQQIVAHPKAQLPAPWSLSRFERSQPRIREAGVIWQAQRAC